MAKYDLKFKLKVVEYRLSTGHGAKRTAKEFCIDHDTVKKWCDEYQHHGNCGSLQSNQKLYSSIQTVCSQIYELGE